MPLKPKTRLRLILLNLFLLFLCFIYFRYTEIDLTLQDLFFNQGQSQWVLDRHNFLMRLFFYKGVKVVIILFFLILLITTIINRKKPLWQPYRRGSLIVLLSILIIPILIGTLKRETGLPCPAQITRYHGALAYNKFGDFGFSLRHDAPCHCFPAGHASGGFALMSLFFLFTNLKNRLWGLGFGVALGWIMGTYKMLIGDHFMSHNFYTMFLATLVILALDACIPVLKERGKKESDP